jgi:short-subunit dehydrogenase
MTIMGDTRQLAVITGASSGIGATFARQLAARGYDLMLVARRTDRLEQLGSELTSQYGIQVEPVTADLTAEADLNRVAARLRESNSLALLVNNAGFGIKGAFHETDPAGQRTMYLLHVVAAETLSHAALQGLVRRRAGGIINVSSVAAFVMGPGNVSYCSTKAWMNSFTEGLWVEMKALHSPVRVQALCPGFTHTEFHSVMGMDKGAIGKSLWMNADFVVSESLKGFDRGDRLVIPGWRYKLLVAVLKLVPRSLVLRGAVRSYNRL